MLKQRVITAAVGVPVIFFAIWFGVPWFSLLIAAATLAGTYEFYHMVSSSHKGYPLTYFGLLWALAVILNPLVFYYKNFNALPIIMTLAVMISLVWILFHSPRAEAFHDWAWTVAGVLYVAWMLSYWLNLRGLEDGKSWVYLALFTTFANDTGSFLVGRAKGKHKLTPAISPGKTWEGAVGGLLSAILGAIIVMTALNLTLAFTIKYWQVILLGFLVSLFAQLGDLVESLLKRNMEVKESGKLLPGHGGILDRFDSLIFVGPVVYYCIIWMM
jgi:phosphatidate cytidylyltransferase